jgi:hypothetical protein
MIIAYAVHMKETYKNMKNLHAKINLKQYWNACGDLKIVATFVGMQLGYSTRKYCCCHCGNGSVNTVQHATIEQRGY